MKKPFNTNDGSDKVASNLVEHWDKEWRLMMPIGGVRFVHARGCEYTRDWDMNGCREVKKFNPKKNSLCPACAKLVYATIGAKDYLENVNKYKKYLNLISETLASRLYVDGKAITYFVGERLYIKCKKDNWYVDFSLDDIKLYHNNYSARQRSETDDWTALGYHLHELTNPEIEKRFAEAIIIITSYDYEKAVKAHEEKRVQVTFLEYDEEYYNVKE